MIDGALFPSWTDGITRGFLIPLVVALGYIYVYPIPAKWVYGHALKRQRELREKRQEVENARVLTFEESQKLMTYYYDREMQSQDQLSQRMKDIEQFRTKIADLEKNQKEPVILHTLPKLKAPVPSPQETLGNIEADILNAMSYAENEGKTYITDVEIWELLGKQSVDMTELRISLENLARKLLIKRLPQGSYMLTHEGRLALKKYTSEQRSKNETPPETHATSSHD